MAEATVRTLLSATAHTDTVPVPDDLSPASRRAIPHLVAAARHLDGVFQEQMHPEARSSLAALRRLDEALGGSSPTKALIELQDLSQGPIATTLANERAAFLPVAPEQPGKNVYPAGATRESIEAFLAEHPGERASILHPLTAVRATTDAALDGDLATLARHRQLAEVHANVETRLRELRAAATRPALYAVPYALAWADGVVAAAGELEQAAAAIEPDDAAFASFLRLRARDLVSNDYEPGDAAWLPGRFARLDAVIGPYEAYDDGLFGVKGFFGARIFVRDEARTAALRSQLQHLQSIEDALPVDVHRTVSADVPVGIFDVLADYGEQRAGSTDAQILPNDPDQASRYGRRILLSRTFILAPDTVARAMRKWRALVPRRQARELTDAAILEGNLWHEIGHYLGPTRRRDGRPFVAELGDLDHTLEELKADLVSVFATAHLLDLGAYDRELHAGNEASLVSDCTFAEKPNAADAHRAGRLVILNGLLEHGAVASSGSRFAIVHERFRDAITSQLREVLALQVDGNHDDADAFIARYSAWDARHEAIAKAIRTVDGARFHRSRNRPLD